MLSERDLMELRGENLVKSRLRMAEKGWQGWISVKRWSYGGKNPRKVHG